MLKVIVFILMFSEFNLNGQKVFEFSFDRDYKIIFVDTAVNNNQKKSIFTDNIFNINKVNDGINFRTVQDSGKYATLSFDTVACKVKKMRFVERDTFYFRDEEFILNKFLYKIYIPQFGITDSIYFYSSYSKPSKSSKVFLLYSKANGKNIFVYSFFNFLTNNKKKTYELDDFVVKVK